MEAPPSPKELVEKAFQLAKESGKAEWWSMTVPVLKNRLLLITDRKFRETDYGVANIWEFLNNLDTVVKLDQSRTPATVVLRSANEEATRQHRSGYRSDSISPDLWRAVLDYSSGLSYVWDAERNLARPAATNENGLVMPTISEVELDKWRDEFIRSQGELSPLISSELEVWKRDRLPTVKLPVQFRGPWNGFLKQKVQSLLSNWFETQSLTLPTVQPPTANLRAFERDAHAELRQFIIDCVRVMSAKELEEVRVAPATALKATTARKSSK